MNVQLVTQASEYARWQEDPEKFWLHASSKISWTRAPLIGCDKQAKPAACWFPDGELNACYNAVDRHVLAGHGQRIALLHISAITGTEISFTFSQLQDEVSRLAGALRRVGVTVGDRVLIYMPMVPEALFAMLACARLGAIHSVVFGGFAARELSVRIDDAQPKVILSASCGLEPTRIVDYQGLINHALTLAAHVPNLCVVLQRSELPAQLIEGRDLCWMKFLEGAEAAAPVSLPSNTPLYILYTSGTTGKPKGVVRDTGGYLVSLVWSMTHVYNTKAGEVFWAASDIGWVVGHSYIVYGPLLQGCTTILYEGKPVGTPDAGAYWRIVARHHVATLFTAPTALRAIKREDPEGKLISSQKLSSLRALFLAGERADPNTVAWAGEMLSVPIIDHWWQTETGGPVVANCLGLGALPIKLGSPTRAVPGFALEVHDERGQSLPANTQGALVLKLPLPPGCLPTLWHDEAGFQASYLKSHPGFFASGDGGYIDEDGYVFVMGRIDDVINIAGHRLSTGELEQALSGHPAVAECAVIGVADELKGTIPIGLVVLKLGITQNINSLKAEFIARVREEVGPVASFHHCLIIARLPKTRSGKILRATLRAIADQRPYEIPATIEDPTVLEEINQLFKDNHELLESRK